MYTLGHSSTGEGDEKSSKSKMVKGVTLTKRLQPHEPKFNHLEKRFIRKGKTFLPFSPSEVIKINALVVSFAKANSEKNSELKSTTYESTHNSQPKMVKIRPFSRKNQTEVPCLDVSSPILHTVQSPSRRMSENRPKNMHILDREKELEKARAKKGQYSINHFNSSKNLFSSHTSLKADNLQKNMRQNTKDDLLSQCTLEIRPVSAFPAHSASDTRIAGGESGSAKLEKMRQLFKAGSNGKFIPNYRLEGRIQTADSGAVRASDSRKLIEKAKESPAVRDDADKDKFNNPRIRPTSSSIQFFREKFERSHQELQSTSIAQ